MSEPLFDFSRFPTRTWPYGTRKAVTVLGADPETRLLGCVDAANEAYFLLGGWNPPVQRGDRGEIIFTEGGPTGGYWRYEAAPEGEPHE